MLQSGIQSVKETQVYLEKMKEEKVIIELLAYISCWLDFSFDAFLIFFIHTKIMLSLLVHYYPCISIDFLCNHSFHFPKCLIHANFTRSLFWNLIQLSRVLFIQHHILHSFLHEHFSLYFILSVILLVFLHDLVLTLLKPGKFIFIFCAVYQSHSISGSFCSISKDFHSLILFVTFHIQHILIQVD
jgi:hypothetical protein